MEPNEGSKQSGENETFCLPISNENAEEGVVVNPSQEPLEDARHPSNQPPAMNDVKSSYELRNRLQQLIQDINIKRKRDNEMLAAFREEMSTLVTKMCSTVEDRIVLMHEKCNTVIQEKLQKVMASIDRIEKLEGEYEEFKQALSMLYNDTCMIPN